MTVVVTGGSGRLGRSVLAAWRARGDDVVNIDLSASGVDGVREERVDLADAAAARDALLRLRPQTIVHLAAIAVPFSAPEERIMAVNTAMTHNVIEGAVASGARRLLVASSPTVIGYGSPTGWQPRSLPIDETHPLAPWNAYSVSKVAIEALVAMAARRGDGLRTGAFRPCYVIAPEEWAGAPTQQGHTVAERLDRPEHAAVSLFNYVDARDAADFTVAWAGAAETVANGDVWFVGAADALARRPLADLVPEHSPALAALAAGLTGTLPAFSTAKAERELGWRARRSWRDELVVRTGAATAHEGIHP